MPESQQGIAQIVARLDRIEAKQDQTNEILETWQAFKTGGRLITGFAKIATAILAVVVFMKIGLASLLGGHKL